ncbi:GDSL-type esterase/lipase family protein [Aliirhizobium terrae]|uniref:SGNH/GDSL hydrolase family protein n=1 Tax=Terrirhizobium terrae TaxID=2926709 RepID=UPI0025759778|nr:GDSL-type esterase/lipase family protein [Rhizobium sp. CC-CFT758]WJH39534.1 GDSL-type esterase/lipase family protein [Rhizobium sp. CC-CFT758]
METRTVGIVIDGDSISSGGFTAGWPPYPTILEAQTSVRVANRAGFGRPLSQCLSQYPKNIAPLFAEGFSWVIIMAGINDLLNDGRNDRSLIADIRTYCAQARATGFKVAIGSLLPAKIGANNFDPQKERYRSSYNAYLASSWAEFADRFIDFSDLISDPADPSQLGDGLHPNAPQRHAMADLVAQSFRLAPREMIGNRGSGTP